MITCCGEALIDMIPSPNQHAYTPHCGGSVFNTTIALGRLNIPTAFFSGLSSDTFGDKIRSTLAKCNVDSSLCVTRNNNTTLTFVTLTNGEAKYAFYDDQTAGQLLSSADLPDIPQNITTLFFGGISLFREPCGTAYETLLLREAKTRVIVIDPNIRVAAIDDEEQYRARLSRLFAASDIVRVSDEDLHWILPGTQTLETKALSLLERGPSTVILTRGADGALGFTSEGVRAEAPTYPAKIQDTVAAGDTFNAGVLAELWRSGFLEKGRPISADVLVSAMRYGALAASITVSRSGANPPWLYELEKPYPVLPR